MMFNACGLLRVSSKPSEEECQDAMENSHKWIHTINTEQCVALKCGMTFGRSRSVNIPLNFHGLHHGISHGISRNHFKVVEIVLDPDGQNVADYTRVKLKVDGGGRFFNGDGIRVMVHKPLTSGANSRPEIYTEGQSFWVKYGCVIELGLQECPLRKGLFFCVVGLRVLPNEMSSLCKDENCIKLLPNIAAVFDKAILQQQRSQFHPSLRTKKLGAMFQLIKGSRAHHTLKSNIPDFVMITQPQPSSDENGIDDPGFVTCDNCQMVFIDWKKACVHEDMCMGETCPLGTIFRDSDTLMNHFEKEYPNGLMDDNKPLFYIPSGAQHEKSVEV